MGASVNPYRQSFGWDQAKRDPAQREKMILKYAPLVKHMAKRFPVWLPPSLNREELESAGILGLLDAIEKFDEGKGIKFQTYAEHRIRGAMLDELRKMDWIPRSVRKDIHRIEEATKSAAVKLGREPEDHEIAEQMGIDLEAFFKMVRRTGNAGILRLDKMNAPYSFLEVLDHASESRSPFDEFKAEELKKVMARVLKALSKKEQLVMSLYYYEEMTMREIANVLNLTESRICQIHSSTLMKLRKKLKTFYES